MTNIPQPKTALLLVDNQKGLAHPTYWGDSRSTPNYEDNIKTLLHTFRTWKPFGKDEEGPLIVHVYNISLNPKSPLHPNAGDGVDFFTFAQPVGDELVMSKHVNSSFIGTDLESVLRKQRIQRLFICGLTTDHCISSTVRMAANLGVVDVEGIKGQVVLVEDATAAFESGNWDAETIHAIHVESLRGEFADIMKTHDVVELLRLEES